MRLTLILIIAFVLNAGARGTAQTVTLSVKDMPLEKVCKEIEKQTGYYFVYAKDLGKETRMISVKVDNAGITEVLAKVFAGLPYTWKIIDKVVVVNTMVQTSQSSLSYIPADDKLIDVEGIVQTEEGQPISEASVTIKATGKGTYTNAQGHFFLKSVSAGAVLVVSHIGFADKMVAAKEKTFLNVHLGAATSILDATVVKGYYTTSNRLNTGSVSTVKGEDLAKSPVSDPLLALAGRVPGLFIAQMSGLPGSNSVVQLRGQNSLLTEISPVTVNDPLYIVDGVPFSSQSLTSPYIGGGIFDAPVGKSYTARVGMSPFNSLNISDIENVEVLKDADATAIYGSRGANGVIIITTKKGKTGQVKTNINLQRGGSRITRRVNLLDTKQYLAVRREAFMNDNWSQGPGDYDINGVWDTTRYTDWQKVILSQPAAFTNIQADISGGNVNNQFVIGAGYNRQGVVFPGNYADERASIHSSIANASLNNRFKIQFSISYSADRSNLPNSNPIGGIFLAPDAPAVYDAAGNLNWQSYGGRATWQNPFSYIVTKAKSNTNYLSGNLRLNYQLVSGLSLATNFGYNHSQMNQTVLYPSAALAPPNDIPDYRTSMFSTSDVSSWIIEPQINYVTRFGKGQLDVLAGSTFQESNSGSRAMIAYGFTNDELLNNPQAASAVIFAGNNSALYRYSAIFGKINLNWDGMYLINLTARRDGSSRFGPGKKFGNFGAVGIGWVFSKVKGIKKLFPGLSFGKFRGSYGITGNDNISDYRYLSTYSSSSSSYQGVRGLFPTLLPNPYYGWQSTKKTELAIELGFLNDKLLLSLSYYRDRCSNQLVGIPLPIMTGFNSVQGNLPATVQNSGAEISINSTNISTKNFTWSSSFNMSIPRNKLISFPGLQNSPYKYQYAVGKPVFSKYVYHYIGVDPQTGIYAFSAKNGNNNDPSAATSNYVISPPIAQFYSGALINNFSYKGIRLEVMVQFVKQTSINYLASINTAGSFNSNVPLSLIQNHWQKPGDAAVYQKATTFLIDVNSFNGSSYMTLSDGSISDASFARVKNLSLSFEIPSKYEKKIGLQNANIFLQCQNLFTITRYQGMDPESGGFNLPPMRTITVGVQLTF